MLIDRFKEMVSKAGPITEDQQTDIPEEEQALVQPSDGEKMTLRQFLFLDETAQHQLEEISSLLTQLREALVMWYSATTPAEEQSSLGKTEDLCSWISEAVRAVKRSIDLVRMQIESAIDSLDIRMRRNMHAALLTKLSDRVKDFREIQDELSHASKAKALRQITRSGISEDKAEELINHGVTAQAVMANSLTTDNSEDLYLKVSTIREKVTALRRIQRSVEDVNQLLTGLAELVLAQASVLDNIESDVVNAKNYAASTMTKLIEADKNANKKMKCIMIVCVILLVLAGIVVGGILIWKKV